MEAIRKRIEKKEEIYLMLRILKKELNSQIEIDKYCDSRNQFNEHGKICIKILKKKIEKYEKKMKKIC